MAEDIAIDLSWLVQLALPHKEFLGNIRHWDNLRVATDDSYIWVKGFTAAQMDHVELKSIPFAKLFYVKDNLFYPTAGLLPAGRMPQLLWTPIERALPVKLEGFNHNLFEIPAHVGLQLVSSAEEQKANVLLTDIVSASSYIETAAAVRLQGLRWTVINDIQALITGYPLLPLDGQVYWQKGRFIYPVGFMPEFEILEPAAAATIDHTGDYLIWWLDEQRYSLLHPSVLQPLTIASWRQTAELLKMNKKPGL